MRNRTVRLEDLRARGKSEEIEKVIEKLESVGLTLMTCVFLIFFPGWGRKDRTCCGEGLGKVGDRLRLKYIGPLEES